MSYNKKIFVFLLLSIPIYLFSQKTISFKENNNQILIEVIINNKPFTFLFDNGCERSILFDKKENLHNHNIIAKTLVYDANEKSDTVFIAKYKIRIPYLNIKQKIKILIIEPPIILREQGINGILGNDIISLYNWEINFTKHTIGVHRKIDTRNFIKLANFENHNRELSTVLSLDNESIDTFAIDLGCNQTLTRKQINKRNIQYVNIGVQESVIESNIDTAFIVNSNICFLKQHCFTNIPIYWDKKNKYNLIGVGFLKKFDVSFIDNSNHIFWVKKKKEIQFYLPNVKVFNSRVVAINYAKERNKTHLKIGQVLTKEQSKAIKSFKLPLSKYFEK